MALPTSTTVAAAIDDLLDAVREVRVPGVSGAVHAIGEAFGHIQKVYTPRKKVTVTDTAEADLAEFKTFLEGEFGSDVKQGDVFEVSGTGDTTDNALAAAKGSAVADTDLFKVATVTPTTITVIYAGADQPAPSGSLNPYD